MGDSWRTWWPAESGVLGRLATALPATTDSSWPLPVKVVWEPLVLSVHSVGKRVDQPWLGSKCSATERWIRSSGESSTQPTTVPLSWPRTLSQFWAPDWRSSTSSWIPCWKVPRRSEVASGWARMLRPTGVSTHAGLVSTEALGLGLEVVAEVAGEAPWVFPDPPEQAARNRVTAAREAPDAILIIRLTLRGPPFERSNTL